MPTRSLPRSLADLLAGFRCCFTAPTFGTFTALLVGFLAQPGQRTVTGMLVGARLSGVWHHATAHRFFSAARWSADQVGLVLLDRIVAWLPATAPLALIVDDSLFKRSGPKVFGTAWHYDAAAPGRRRVAWGNNWVVLGVLVAVPCLPHRQVCLPILARLWQPKRPDRTKLGLARELVWLVAARHPDRQVNLVGDAAYAGRLWRDLPERVTVTTRLRADAALYQLPPARQPGRRGRPRSKGDRLPELIMLAALIATRWQPATVACYGQRKHLELHSRICLWYTVWRTQPVQVVLARTPGAPDDYDLALVSTDLDATPAQLVERYAARWAVEQAFLDARQVLGVGQARNRTRLAVQRTVPFGLLAASLLVVWYAAHGQPAADVAAHRARAPWYRTKQAPSLADMLAALRRELLAAQYGPSLLIGPTLEELLAAQVTWPLPAA
jgi:hypothetical protein